MTLLNTELPNYLLGMSILAERKRGKMDLREFVKRQKSVLYRLTPDGNLQRKPPCADCDSRGIPECFKCPDDEDCIPWSCENTCQFKDMCEADEPPEDDINYISLGYNQKIEDLMSKLSFKLTSFYVSKIDNGFIIYYKIGDKTESNKRHCPDIESLCRFITEHTE